MAEATPTTTETAPAATEAPTNTTVLGSAPAPESNPGGEQTGNEGTKTETPEAAAAAKEAFTVATDPEAKKTAYAALSAEDKKAAFDAMSEEDRKALDLKDPSAPAELSDFKLPEGITVDADAMAKAKEFFTSKGLSQEDAQAAVDLHMELAAKSNKQMWDHWQETNQNWVKEIKDDSEIGGAKFDESIKLASRAIEFVKVDGLKEALDMTGAGNNPAIVKAFVRIGQAISEDKFHAGNPGTTDTRSIAERLYDGSPKGAAT